MQWRPGNRRRSRRRRPGQRRAPLPPSAPERLPLGRQLPEQQARRPVQVPHGPGSRVRSRRCRWTGLGGRGDRRLRRCGHRAGAFAAGCAAWVAAEDVESAAECAAPVAGETAAAPVVGPALQPVRDSAPRLSAIATLFSCGAVERAFGRASLNVDLLNSGVFLNNGPLRAFVAGTHNRRCQGGG